MKSSSLLLPALAFLTLATASLSLRADPDVVPLDDLTPPADNAGASASGTSAAQSDRAAKIKEAFRQLNLTDDQKKQIVQIHQTVTDKTERRKQIMAVLTLDQRKQLFQELKGSRQGA